MTGILILVLLVAAVGWVPAAVSYARREPEVPGRLAPALLRGLALLVVFFLLVNPVIPGADPAFPSSGPDRSTADGRWILEEDHPLVEAGVEPGGGSFEAEGGAAGGAEGARLRVPPDSVPWTLLRLAEAGAREVTVVSPFRGDLTPLTAAVEAVGAMDRPPRLTLYPVGEGLRNAGIVALEVDPTPGVQGGPGSGAGAMLDAVVLVGGEGATGDSAWLEVRAGEATLLARWVPVPEVGARARVPFRIPLSDLADAPGAGDAGAATAEILVEARITLEDDAFPADDRRSRVLTPDAGEGGILLLAHGPDPEPRILLPLLEQATGLGGEGWIRIGPDQFVALTAPGDPVRRATSEALAREIPRARLLVLQGDASTLPPGWAQGVAAHPARILLRAGASPRVWSLDPALPPSPLAGFLPELTTGTAPEARGATGAAAPALASLPPLAVARSASGTADDLTGETAGGRAALRVRSPGEPPRDAVVLVGDDAEGARTVEVRVSGLWRWAGREGAGGALYRGIWGGAAGWVLASGEQAPAGSPGARPDPDTLRTLEPPGDLALLRERVADRGPRGEGEDGLERRLRSHPLPWFLVIGLVAAEWILRRRLGLR